MSVYKSEEGRRAIREACGELYGRWPIPAESIDLDTGDFGTTHCLAMGPVGAPPLVLLHGSASNSASWMGYAPGWAKDHRVYALDIPGHPGLSDDRRPGLGNGETRKWFGAALDVLGLGTVRFCGMSLGSTIGLDFALAHPGRLEAICLLTTGGVRPWKGSFFLRILPYLFMGDWGAKRINRIVYGPVPNNPEAEAFSLLVARYYVPLTEPLPQFVDGALAGISVPLLYFGGTADALLDSAGTAERLSALIPSAQTVLLEGVGHVILDQGDRIREFFAQVQPRVFST